MSVARRAALSWLTSSGIAIVALVAIGWLPTARWGGDRSTLALLAGCGASFVAAALGALPVLKALAGGNAAKPQAVAGWSMALRSGATLAGALWLALTTGLPRTPLVVWIGLAYGALLVVETRWTVRWLSPRGR